MLSEKVTNNVDLAVGKLDGDGYVQTLEMKATDEFTDSDTITAAKTQNVHEHDQENPKVRT